MKLVERVAVVKDVFCKLVSALGEVALVLEQIHTTGIVTSVPAIDTENLRTSIFATETLRDELIVLVEEVKSIPLPVLLRSEYIQLLLIAITEISLFA
jgi:hypothetical protein